MSALDFIEAEARGAVADPASAWKLPFAPTNELLRNVSGTRPSVTVPTKGVEVSEVPDSGKAYIDRALGMLYGKTGEHWIETPTEMLESPEGQQRYKLWASMLAGDPVYAPRFQRHLTTISNQEVALHTAISEYKEARRKDATIKPTAGVSAQIALNVGLELIPGGALANANILRKSEKVAALRLPAGGALPALMKAKVPITGWAVEALPATLGATAITGLGKLGSAGLKQGARSLAGLAASPTKLATAGQAAVGGFAGYAAGGIPGGIAGVVAGPAAASLVRRSPILSEAAKKFSEGRSLVSASEIVNLEQKYVKAGSSVFEAARLAKEEALMISRSRSDTKLLANINGMQELANQAGVQLPGMPGWIHRGGLAAMAKGVMGGEPGEMLAWAAGAAGLPPVAKWAEKIKVAKGVSLGPTVWQGVGGAAVGSGIGDEDDMARNAALGAGIAMLGGSAGRMGLYKAGVSGNFFKWKMYAPSGDFNELGKIVGNIMPEAFLRNMEPLKPFYQMADEATEFMDQRMKVFGDRINGVFGPKMEDADWLNGPFKNRLLEKIPAGTDLELDKMAYEYRNITDELALELIQRGMLSQADYIQNYIPSSLNVSKFFNDIPRKSYLRNSKAATTFGNRLYSLVDKAPVDATNTIVHTDPSGKATNYETLSNFLSKEPDEFLAGYNHTAGSWVGTPNSRYTGGAFNFKMKDGELAILKDAVLKHKTVGVGPMTVISIAKTGYRDIPTSIYGFQRLEGMPKELFDKFLEERTGSKLPFEDPLTSLVRYVDRSYRKLVFDPLIKGAEIKPLITGIDPKTGQTIYQMAEHSPGSTTLLTAGQAKGGLPSTIPIKAGATVDPKDFKKGPLLREQKFILEGIEQSAEDYFKDKPNARSLFLKMLASKMDYRLPPEGINIGQGIEDALWNLGVKTQPGTSKAFTRGASDFVYFNFLAFKPATAIRGLMESIIASTGIGHSTFIDGIAEVSKNPKYWEDLARKSGAARSVITEQQELSKTFEKDWWRSTMDAGMSMISAAETKGRVWTFTSAYKKIMIDGPTSLDMSLFRKDVVERLDQLKTRIGKSGYTISDYAMEVGKEYSDLTHWVYGKSGSPLLMRSQWAPVFGTFGSWPANYVALLHHWVKSGNMDKVLSLGLTTSMLDTIAKEQFGITRFTGLSSQGGQRETKGLLPMAFPGGPMAGAGDAPIPSAVMGLKDFLIGAGTGDPKLQSEGLHNAYTSVPPFTMAERGLRIGQNVMDEEKQQALIRALAFVPYREKFGE